MGVVLEGEADRKEESYHHISHARIRTLIVLVDVTAVVCFFSISVFFSCDAYLVSL